MAQIANDRRSFLVALVGGAGLVWLAASSRQRSAVEYNVPEISIAKAKELLQAGAMAIDVRDQEKFAYRHFQTQCSFLSSRCERPFRRR